MSEGKDERGDAADRLRRGFQGVKALWGIKHSKNLALLREEEDKLATEESRRNKNALENSIICLLYNLVGLSAVNLMRGFNPQQHELKHRWSKPLHLFFLVATGINLCAVGYFGYSYVSKASA
jgi:hypothetical protein